MNEEHRVAGFKALLESHKTNACHLQERDGSFQLWADLTAEGRLENIARDAAFYDVPFEQFAQAVRESVDGAAIEVTALRLAMRSTRELYEVEKLLPEEGIEPPLPLVKRVREVLNAQSAEYGDSDRLTVEEQAALFAEMREEEAAARSHDAPWYGKVTYEEMLNEKAKPPAVEKVNQNEKGKDRGIER